MITRLIPMALFLLLLTGCSQSVQQNNPAWVDELIDSFQSQPVGNPPQSIWQYRYRGSLVYFVPAQCCDQYSTLYDGSGNRICAPDGGLTGTGDGLCADFFTDRSEERPVWQDERSR